MIARDPATYATYFEMDESTFMLATSSISQNGDDAIELFYNGDSVEIFGELDVDGSGESWEYMDSWVYKVDGAWTYGGVNCADGAETNATADCVYPYTGVYTTGTVIPDCIFTLTLNDQYNDGWSNSDASDNNIDVLVNGVVSSNYTIAAGTESFTISVAYDDVVTLSYNVAGSGNWASENSFVLTDSEGTVLTEGDSTTNGDAVTCAVSTFDVTFSVNTANITVGANGMYVGGGVLGGSDAYAMTDDGTGTWTVTVALAAGLSGNYIFLNSPNGSSDWGTKENLNGQECADPSNYDDRILAEVTADTTLLHCFGSCETDGTCPTPSDTYATTFTVNVTDGYVDYDGNTQAIGDNIVYLNGNFNGWCGACNPMTDNGDGTWSSTVELEAGAYEYKFTVNGWDGAQEEWTADFASTEEGSCLITDGTYTNRSLTVTDSAQELSTVSWNSCTDATNTSITGPWCEAFEGGEVPPAEWTSYIGTNGAGTGSNWTDGAGTDGGTGAFVGYENSGDVNEDWLVTPMFTPGDDSDWLTYYELDQYTTDYGSSYSIRVSTTSQTDHASFEVISEYGEMNSGADWLYNEADLSAYIGIPIYVAFVLTNNDGDGWALDEICVGGAGLSVSDNTLLDMRIYPNPSNGSYVTIQSPVNGVKYVEVFDITGKRLMNTTLSADTLDVSSISSGMYLVKVTIEGQSKTSKLIIR